MKTYWANFKSGRKRQTIGPFPNREDAVTEALMHKPKHKSLCTGYGSGGVYFDIRWHDKETSELQS
jgi:hypothetical protein